MEKLNEQPIASFFYLREQSARSSTYSDVPLNCNYFCVSRFISRILLIFSVKKSRETCRNEIQKF